MANQPIFKQAPLPFIGQKRMFLKHFERLLERIPCDGEGWTIVDAFGGSGLLSHVAKRLKPKATVIYNDFDGYAERLAHIDDINRLRQAISEFVRYVDAMIDDKWDNWQAFQDYERIIVNTSTSYSGKYEDNMVFKF